MNRSRTKSPATTTRRPASRSTSAISRPFETANATGADYNERPDARLSGSGAESGLPGRAGDLRPEGLLALLQGPRQGGPPRLHHLRVRELVRHPGPAAGRGRADAVDGDPHPAGHRPQGLRPPAAPGGQVLAP